MNQHMNMKNNHLYFSLMSLLFSNGVTANQLSITQGYVNNQTILKPQLVRDPFTPSNLMYEVASNSTLASGAGNAFLPSQNTGLPSMRIKGFVGGKNNSFALLEIEGAGTYMVKEGDEINYNPRQPRSAIRISKIDRSSVTIETGLIGTFKVQR